MTCNGRTYDVSTWNLSAVADAVWESFADADGCENFPTVGRKDKT
jgi:hypothetical protein